jgi:hypothetical protein
MASSSAPDLPALFHAGSAPGVHPSELCSFRAAERRLQRRCPLVVGMNVRLTRADGGRRRYRSTAPGPPPPHMDVPSERPSPSGLCSTRKSATPSRLFRPERSAWLSWDSSPPGYSPSPAGHGLHRASPHEVPGFGRKRPKLVLFRVSLPGEVGLPLSRLPTLMGFRHLVTFAEVRFRPDPGVAS